MQCIDCPTGLDGDRGMAVMCAVSFPCALYILCVLYIPKLADANIATILETRYCSKVILTLAQPMGLYQLWQHRQKPDITQQTVVNKVVQKRCRPDDIDQFVMIGYHYATKTFFITNTGQRLLEAYDEKNGEYNRRRVVFKGISRKVKGLAVDWVHNNVYWADPAYDAIMMTTTDGSCQVFKCAVVAVGASLDNPTGLAVHPFIGRIFWTDGDLLEAADLDGTNRTVLMRGLKEPRGVTIDYNSDRLYWIDQRGSTSFVLTSDMEGRGHRTIAVRQNSSLNELDIYQGYIVMTDREKSAVAIHRVAHNKTVQKTWGGVPLGVVIDVKDMRGRRAERNTSWSHSNRGVILLAKRDGIFRMERNFADAKENTLQPFLEDNTTRVYSLTSDAHTHHVYFYEDKSNSIQRVKLNLLQGEGESFPETPDSQILTKSVQQASDLAIDWITKNLYWTDKPNGQIMVSRDNGKYPTVILERHIKEPRTIVVDPLNKYLFWGDGQNIGRAELDGSDPKHAIFKVIHGNHRLAVDPNSRRIYYNNNNLLCYGDYLGQINECRELATSLVMATGLDVMNDYIIYSASLGGLYAQDKDDFTYIGKSKSQDMFHDIAFHHVSHQPMADNKCTKTRNGGCEQLCLPNLTEKGYSCACTVGYWSWSDGTCKKAQLMEPYLIFSDLRLGRIYQSSLIIHMYGMFTLQSLQMPKDVAFDHTEKKIYWTDANLSTINCAYINGSHQRIVYADKNIRPKNIALDVASKLVYFVDFQHNVGAVSVVTGAYKKIIDKDIIRAEDIALYPEKGLMFITGQTEVRNIDTNTTERVHCVTMADMDGINLEQVAVGLGRPNGIIVYKDRVIWADAKRQTLEEVRMWSWNRTVLVDQMRGAPIDLVAHRDRVFWTETGARSYLNDNKTAGECMPTSRFFNLAGLAVATDEFSYSSVCEGYQCPNPYSLCTPTPRGAICNTPQQKYAIDNCYSGREQCSTREKHMQQTFCRVPVLDNGTVFNVTSKTYVPVNFKIQMECNAGFVLKRTMQAQHSERYTPLKPRENICLSRGNWAEIYTCKWNMDYQIEGNFSRGIVKFYNSSEFLVPPGVWSLDVICIGGGGGGYRFGRKGGNGGGSSFDREHGRSRRHRATGGLRAGGGHGGKRIQGGKGGYGYRYEGGLGGNHNTCHFGGAAGQVRQHLPACSLGVTYCLFCGAGGYGNPSDCSNTSASCSVFSGACSGPWAEPRIGWSGSDFGGGAGSLEGGSGGAGGFSRKRWMRAKPGHIVPVVVGKGGIPSSARAGDGLVVVAWGGKIEDFLGEDINWTGRCLWEDSECSCIPKARKDFSQITKYEH